MLLSWGCDAQLVLDRHVLSCNGIISGVGIPFSSTAGQVAYETVSSPVSIITQGFQQPMNAGEMSVELAVYHSACSDFYDVKIKSFFGCGDMSGLAIRWNSNQGDMVCGNLPSITSLEIATSSGCQFFAIYDFSVFPGLIVSPCDLEFFNYISPNGDGDNDVWIIRNVDSPLVENSEVKIFGRWGGLVWEGIGYDNREVVWCGKDNNGVDLPDGTYYYVATINGQAYNGFIELFR